jgi:ABC-type glycerol-3-phosphate transport system substrate-binding protein
MSKQLKLLMILCFCVTALSVSAQQPVVLQLSLSGFSEDSLIPVVEQYEALNPGIEIQLNPYQGFGSPIGYDSDMTTYQDDLASYFSSADVVYVDSDLTSEITRAGYVLDLSPLIQSDPNFNQADFHFSMLNSYQWDLGQWAIPASGDFIVMSYQPEAFDNAGLAYPAEWWTIDDLDLAVRELTQYDDDGDIDVPGINLQGFNDSLTIRSLFVSLLGHGVVDELALPATPDFTDPLLADYLEVWNTMVEDDLFEVPDDVEEEDIPLQIGNPQQVFGGFGGGQDETFTVATLLPGGYAGLSTSGYAISSGTQYPQESYDFIMYLINQPDVVNILPGVTSAKIFLDTSNPDPEGLGAFFGGNVVEEMEPLLDTALIQALPVGQMRYSRGITDVLNAMQIDGVDALTALLDASTEMQDRVTFADQRARDFPIFVQAPEVEIILNEGQISLDFAILGGGNALELWEQIAEEFVAFDPEIAEINVEQEFPLNLTGITQNYQCFYSGTNIVSNLDLSTVLSLDPLIFADFNYDPNDYVAGVLEQVQVNNQTYALPLQISPVVLRFNEDILSQAGVFSPQGTWMISEFEDTLEQLQFSIEEGQAPLELTSSAQSSVLALIAIYGGIPFDTRTTPLTVDFTSPASVNAIQQFLNLAVDGKIDYSTQGGFGGGGGGQNLAVIPLYSNILNAIPGGFGGGGGGGQGSEAGIVTFPQGFEFNAAVYDLASAYISASAQYPEACYRFISYVAQSTNIFESMPARSSLINGNDLFMAQGENAVNFYREFATLLEQPNTIALPANIDFSSGTFGVTAWLFEVFGRYLGDEVVDLEAELMDAQQITNDYLLCVNSIEPIDENAGIDIGDFFGSIQACQASVNPE